jgi:hypothetical protein
VFTPFEAHEEKRHKMKPEIIHSMDKSIDCSDILTSLGEKTVVVCPDDFFLYTLQKQVP